MATCTNCTNNTGTISTGSIYSGTYPGSQFGYFYSYPSTCPGGCLYLTSSGYRCSNSTSGTCSNCNSGCNSGCNSCNNNGCGSSGCVGIRPL